MEGRWGRGRKPQHLSTTQTVFRASDCAKMIATYCITQKMSIYACESGELKNDILNIFQILTMRLHHLYRGKEFSLVFVMCHLEPLPKPSIAGLAWPKTNYSPLSSRYKTLSKNYKIRRKKK